MSIPGESGPRYEALGPIADVVKRLGALTGISMIMVIGPAGEELYRWYRTTVDMSRMRLSSSEVLDVLSRVTNLMARAGSGSLDDLIVRTSDKVAVVQAVGPIYLVAIADRSANLALLLIRSRAAANEIAKLVGWERP